MTGTLRESLFQRLLPIVDRFAGDVAELIAKRVELQVESEVARFDEAMALALSSIADGSTEDTDVEVEKPARDRGVDRADVRRRAVRKAPRVGRAAAAEGDRARALPSEVAPAASSTPARKAEVAEAVKRSCGCAARGRHRRDCTAVVDRDVKPANIPQAPPPVSKSDRFARIEAAAAARRGAGQ